MALRNRRLRAAGDHRDVVFKVLSQVGATEGEGDIFVQVDGASVQVKARTLTLTQPTPPEAYAWTAIFLACESSHRREGPFALYDTFAPTALRGRTALLDGPGGVLAETIALDIARVGARVLSAAPLSDAVLTEARALGRHVTSVKDPYETRPDIVVNLGQRGAHLAHKLRPEVMVNIVPQEGWDRFNPDGLRKALFMKDVRVNAIGIAETTDPQEVARLVVFLASEAGRYIAGRCIPLQ